MSVDSTRSRDQEKEDEEVTVLPVVHLERLIYDQDSFSGRYVPAVKPKLPIKQRFRGALRRLCGRSTRECWKTNLKTLLPCVQIMRHYKWREWIVGDVVSGISVGVIHIPQSMGYALFSRVPATYGLYSSFFPLIIYFLFGTSRHLSIGTVALVSLLVGNAVDAKMKKIYGSANPIAPPGVGGGGGIGGITAVPGWAPSGDYWNMTWDNGTTSRPQDSPFEKEVERSQIQIAMTLALIVGIIQFLMGVLRLGVVGTFMSTPFNSAFMTGSAFHTATSQIPTMLGYKIPAISGMFTVPLQWRAIIMNITKTNPADIITALITVAILVFLKEFINEKYKAKLKVPVPAEFIVLVLGIIVAEFAQLNRKYQLKIIGKLDNGIPPPAVPGMLASVDGDFILDSFVIAIVAFVVCISMAKIYSRRYKYPIDVNQELLAYGAVNGLTSFLNCFPTAQAPPRTLVQEATGGKTQVSGLVSAVLILIVCLFLGPVFFSLPKAVLASIILVALFPLFKQFRELKVYWKINKFDFVVWLVTCFSTWFLDLGIGIAIGIGWNFFTMAAQSYVVKGYGLTSADESDIFVARGAYMKTTEIEGIRIFRFESDLFFANVEKFKRQLFKDTVDPQKATVLKERKLSKVSTHPAAADGSEKIDDLNNSIDGDISRKNFLPYDGKITAGNGLRKTTTTAITNRGYEEDLEDDKVGNMRVGGRQETWPPPQPLLKSEKPPVRERKQVMIQTDDLHDADGPRKSSVVQPSSTPVDPSQPKVEIFRRRSTTCPPIGGDQGVAGDHTITSTAITGFAEGDPDGPTRHGGVGHRDHFFSNPPGTHEPATVVSPLATFYERPTIDELVVDTSDEEESELEDELGDHLGEVTVTAGAGSRRPSRQSLLFEIHTIILDCAPIGYIDFNGLLTIRQLFEDYREAGIRFLLAGCGKFMLAKLKSAGVYEEFASFVFPSLFDAVMATKLERSSEEEEEEKNEKEILGATEF